MTIKTNMSKFTIEQMWDMLFPGMEEGDPKARLEMLKKIKEDDAEFRKHAEAEIERLSGMKIDAVYDRLMRGEKVMVTTDIQAN